MTIDEILAQYDADAIKPHEAVLRITETFSTLIGGCELVSWQPDARED